MVRVDRGDGGRSRFRRIVGRAQGVRRERAVREPWKMCGRGDEGG